MTGFFQTVKAAEWTLPDACPGANFDADIEKIKKALESMDFMTAFALLNQLKNDLKNVCPVADILQIVKEVNDAIDSGAYFRNILNNLNALIKMIIEGQSLTDEKEIGIFLGKVYKIAIQGKAKSLKFLSADSRDLALTNSPTIEDFINGFIQGTSDVALEKNQCIIGSKAFLPALAAAVDQLITAFKTMKGLKEAFTNFLNTAMKLKDVEGNCHFISLATTLLSLENPITLAKIGWRITTNILKFVSHIKDAYSNGKGGDFKGCGSHVGGVFQIVFDYHTQ